LDSQVVLTRWYENSLALFGEEEYAAFARSLHEQGSYNPKIRMARMEIFGGASLVGVDGQGRMTIPERMLGGFLLDLEKDRDLVLLGDWNRVILHSGLRFRELSTKAQVNLDEALTQVEVSARESKPEIQAEREA
ncbi:MAG: hypothetical protein KC964_09395, partial [Candidatus Omnitrophica bacterium]|nr:hypothetical protein [Candidatus Omnitrophota bacterium]